MVIMMMVVVVMMVHHRRRGFGGFRGRPSGGASDCGLREGVSAEAEREHGSGGKGLDHGNTFLWLGKPKWVASKDRDLRLNSI